MQVDLATEAESRSRSSWRSSPFRSEPSSRWLLAVIGVGFLAITFAQSSGLIEDDTRLSMVMSPLSFIGSALHVWSQNIYGGTAQLGTGFLFPMGFFFAVTHLLHIPTWCAERIWLALLLTTACWGVVRLCEALGIGTRWTRVVAGLAYCAAPLVFTWTTISDQLLGGHLAPVDAHPLGHRLAGGLAPPGRGTLGGGGGPHGGRQCGDHLRRAAPGAHLAGHPPAGSTPPCLVRLVGHRPGPGLLLVARGHALRRQVRLQLPALHGDLDGDHEHHLGVRVAPGHFLLVGLLRPGWTALPGGLDPRLHCSWHRRDRGGGGVRSGRPVPPHPRTALFDHVVVLRCPRHRGGLCRIVRGALLPSRATPLAGRAGAVPQCEQVLPGRDAAVGPRAGLHAVGPLCGAGPGAS
jgi:hypothetical protein